MLVAGQVDIDCVFGRIGCLNGSFHGKDPYRDIEIPVGTRWQDGEEFIIELEEKYGVEMAKLLVPPNDYSNPPTYVLHLPPDGEMVAIWRSCKLIHHADSWALDYPDDEWEGKTEIRDLSGMSDSGSDWWDEWFTVHPLFDGGIIIPDEDKLGRSWDEDRAEEQYEALLRTIGDIKAGFTSINPELPYSGRVRIGPKLKAHMEEWVRDTISKLQEDQFRIDIEVPDFSLLCSWCLVSAHDTSMQLAGDLQLCDDCYDEYDHERNEMLQECHRLQAKGQRYQGVLEGRGDE
jgi:hypothetical protein